VSEVIAILNHFYLSFLVFIMNPPDLIYYHHCINVSKQQGR